MSIVQEYEVIFYEWKAYGYIDIPERPGYRITRLVGVVKEGKNGVNVDWLKIE